MILLINVSQSAANPKLANNTSTLDDNNNHMIKLRPDEALNHMAS